MSDDTTRRRFVRASLSVAVLGGVAGCTDGGQSAGTETGTGTDTTAATAGTTVSSQQFPPGSIVLEFPDGTRRAVEPVEAAMSVSEYYSYDTANTDSSATPDELAMEDTVVTFVYRNTLTGEYSLVVIAGDATTTSDGGGKVPVTFTGVGGAAWQVQDGSPGGSGFGDVDPYSTGSGSLGDTESVIWGWDDDRTDGGALGPLGASFDIDVTLTGEATVDGITARRQGLDAWVFVDGAAIDDPIDLADLGVETTTGTADSTTRTTTDRETTGTTTTTSAPPDDLTAALTVVGKLDTTGSEETTTETATATDEETPTETEMPVDEETPTETETPVDEETPTETATATEMTTETERTTFSEPT